MEIKINCESKEYIPIDRLKNFQGNLKELHKSELEKLKRSILKHGFSFPVFIWRDYILDGHQRIFALNELLKDGHSINKIPVVKIKARSKTDAAEKLLVLNSRYAQITNDGLYEYLNEYDLDIMAFKDEIELSEIDMDDFISGWIEDENVGLTDDDAIPEVPEDPVSKLGDLYILGEHRLLCGDATKQEDVERLMDDKKSNMVFTDPPYNVNYGISKNPRHRIRSIQGDAQSDEDWEKFCRSLYNIFKLYNLGDIYQWGASSPEGMKMRLWLVEMGCHWSATIIWKKEQLILTPAKYQRIYEPCFYGWFNKSSFRTDRKQVEVWEIDRPLNSKLHPTMKPVELCIKGIKNSSNPNDIVQDLFGGSGSTLIACEKTNRRCFMMEIDPYYCDVIVKRWEDYTGKKAELINEARSETKTNS